MANIIAVGIGGFLGAISRYSIGLFLTTTNSNSLPYPTLFINVFGCFLFGYFVNHNLILNSHFPLKEFLLIGILGGFTTYSTFGFEFILLLQNGNSTIAVIYIFLSLIFGGLAIFAGLNLYQIYS